MLKGMVAFIAGAAGSLGSATAKKLISEEMKVVLLDLPSSSGAELERNLGSNAKFIPGDVTSTPDISKAFQETEETFGRLDAIINCAGIFHSRVFFNFTKLTPVDYDEINDCIRVNLLGTLNVIRLGVGLIGKNKPDSDGLRGIVINTSGFGATDGQLGHVAMASVWGGISSMTMPLTRELGHVGIRVMTISPGIMESNVTAIWPEKLVRSFGTLTPSPKRLGRPEEYAELVKSIITVPYLNGEVIRLDGGLRFSLS